MQGLIPTPMIQHLQHESLTANLRDSYDLRVRGDSARVLLEHVSSQLHSHTTHAGVGSV